MDDLSAAIADFLRRHSRRLDPARAEELWRETSGSLRAYTGQAVYCRVCGRPITSGEGLFDVEKLRADRACVDHYVPF